MKIIGNIRVGKRDVDPGKPSHVSGVRQGNEGARRQVDLKEEGGVTTATNRRSTGIAPKLHGPIDPRMPNLTPP